MFGLLTTGMVKLPQDQMALVAETLFPKEWLDSIADEEDGEWQGKKRREMVETVRSINFDYRLLNRLTRWEDWFGRRIY